MNLPDQLILYAEDEANDVFLLRHAFKEAGLGDSLIVVEDGKAAMDYLAGRSVFSDRARHPLPCLVLLDINLPGTSGLEVLKWIRTMSNLSTLPVLILTSSNQDGDIQHAYSQGANGYLVKPSKIDEMVTMARAIKDYWLAQNRGSVECR